MSFNFPTSPEDLAYQMLLRGLKDPTKQSIPVVYRAGCYICEDHEFALMGLPLCQLCPWCKKGHVPADDTICDDCGKCVQEYYVKHREAS